MSRLQRKAMQNQDVLMARRCNMNQKVKFEGFTDAKTLYILHSSRRPTQDPKLYCISAFIYLFIIEHWLPFLPFALQRMDSDY